jgi:hypothetical protein
MAQREQIIRLNKSVGNGPSDSYIVFHNLPRWVEVLRAVEANVPPRNWREKLVGDHLVGVESPPHMDT